MRVIACAVLFWVGISASLVHAQSAAEKTRMQIEAQGFEVYKTKRTWLGRIVFYANNEEFEREIVVERGSGEILRDVWKDRTEAQSREKARTGTRSDRANQTDVKEPRSKGGNAENALEPTDQEYGQGGAAPESNGDGAGGGGHGEGEGGGHGDGGGGGHGEGSGGGGEGDGGGGHGEESGGDGGGGHGGGD